MTEITILNTLKQSFEKVAPKHDGRVKLPHLEFLSGLIFFFLGNTKSLSLESMRGDLMSTFVIHLSKGAFWERLTGQRLKKMLYDLLDNLMQKLPAQALIGSEILDKLGVSRIRLVDASIISLWDGASNPYPCTFMSAGIKWHLCFDLFAGKMNWFKTTAASVHNGNGFPDIKSLANQLIIFDLGYWDYGLLINIAGVKGFFLSRVKSDAAFVIKSVVTGLFKSYVDQGFSAVKLKERSQSVIGFWNPVENKYHWYITNLVVVAYVIYPLYKARWKIKLLFKGCKQSFNLDKKLLTSNNDNIIESLILSSMIARLATSVVLNISVNELTKDEKLAIIGHDPQPNISAYGWIK